VGVDYSVKISGRLLQVVKIGGIGREFTRKGQNMSEKHSYFNVPGLDKSGRGAYL
jgi:hypothetical protein